MFAAVLAGMAVFIAGVFFGSGYRAKATDEATETRTTRVDTMAYVTPQSESELLLTTLSYKLPLVYRGSKDAGAERPVSRSVKTDSTSACNLVALAYGSGAGGEPRCSASEDSAVVELPVVQRHYADSTYEAWVSGPLDPRLDSVKVFAPTTIITQREWKPPKRWHFGVTAGYGYGPGGFQPYVGIGVTYSILSF